MRIKQALIVFAKERTYPNLYTSGNLSYFRYFGDFFLGKLECKIPLHLQNSQETTPATIIVLIWLKVKTCHMHYLSFTTDLQFKFFEHFIIKELPVPILGKIKKLNSEKIQNLYVTPKEVVVFMKEQAKNCANWICRQIFFHIFENGGFIPELVL